MPVAPTVFTENEELDLEGQRRVVDFLVDARADAVCVLANYSEQFSLADDERLRVMEASLLQASDRIPVVVTTSHFSAEVARARVLQAHERGARMVMMMPPFYGATVRVSDEKVVEYFKRVFDDTDIDLMIQDAPMSTTPLSVSILARLAREIPQFRYAKIEVPQTAQKVRDLVAMTEDRLPQIFDGEEGITLIPDLEAGVKGTMSSCVIPDRLGAVVRAYHSGDVDGATSDWEDILPLIHYENRQVGLAAAKYLLKEGGVIRSYRTRAPLPQIGPIESANLLAIARRKRAMVLEWAR